MNRRCFFVSFFPRTEPWRRIFRAFLRLGPFLGTSCPQSQAATPDARQGKPLLLEQLIHQR